MMLVENDKSMRTLAMLRYQADRYQAMGNGSMCQRVNAEIRRLMEKLGAEAKMQRLSRNWVKAFFMPFSFVSSLIQHLRIED